MKIKQDKVDYSGNTEIVSREYGVTNMSVIADLLSNMYSDPILAVVREYVCNALDSHKEAGKKDTPITIVCPNSNHLYFEVRDEGLGLSDEMVDKLFNTFGGTTKNQTDDLIGGFGIGSKSAFAYSNDFQVISVYDGVERTYINYKNDAGRNFEKVMEVKTDAHNGVTVKIPVKQNDISIFKNKIIEVAKWLDTTPNIIGISYFEPVKFTVKEESYDYGIIDDNKSYDKYVRIKMGEVVYTTNIYHDAFKQSVILFYPIGAFKIAPNRESIIIKPEDEKLILDHLNKICDYEKDKIYNSLNNEKTLYRAIKEFNAHKKIFNSNYSVKFKWKSHKDSYTNTGLYYYKTNYTSSKVAQMKVPVMDIRLIVDTNGKKRSIKKYIRQLIINKKLSFYVGDVILVITAKTPFGKFMQMARAGFPEVKYFNIDDIEMPKLFNIQKPTPDVKIAKRRSLNFNNNISVGYDIYNNKEINISTDEYPYKYIITTRGKIGNLPFNKRPSSILEVAGIKDDKILVIPKSLESKINKKWINVTNHVENAIKETLMINNKNLVNSRYMNNNSGCKKLHEIISYNIKLNGISPLALKMIDTIYNTLTPNEIRLINSLNEAESKYNYTTTKNYYVEAKINDLISKIFNKIHESYPLLPNFKYYGNKNKLTDDEKQYIHLMNKHVYKIAA